MAKIVTISGERGTGKTTIGALMMKRAIESGVAALWCGTKSVFDMRVRPIVQPSTTNYGVGNQSLCRVMLYRDDIRDVHLAERDDGNLRLVVADECNFDPSVFLLLPDRCVVIVIKSQEPSA